MKKLDFNVVPTMAGIMICLFLAALDNSIVATAMPKIIKSLGGAEYYSLPFTAYLLFSTVIIPIGGKLSDLYGRKKVLIFSVVSFILMSALCGLSQNMFMLVLFRGLQGASGGVVMSSTFIVTSSIFPPKDRGKYIGILASMHGLASLLGPIAGGVITDLISWHWVFYINLPIGFAAIYLVKKHLPLMKQNDSEKLDYKTILFFLFAIVPMLICISEGGKSLAWDSIYFIGLSSIAVLMLVVFILNERKSKSPLLPKGMLKEPVFKKSAIGAASAYVAMFGLILYIPYLLQYINNESASFSGMMMIPMSFAIIIGGMVGGKLISTTEKFKLQGFLNLFISSIGMSILFFQGITISYPILIIGIVITGFGIGMNFPVVNIAPQAVFDKKQLGIVISTLEFFQVMGGVIATAVFGNMLGQSMTSIILISIFALLIGAFTLASLNQKRIKEGFEINFKSV
jgi:EmrB/QacA subfamily drug resistance transporter